MGILSEEDKHPKQWSDTKIIQMLRPTDDMNLLNSVRQKIYSGMAAIEQSQCQRRPPGPVEIRRQEFILAVDVIDLIETAIDLKGSGI